MSPTSDSKTHFPPSEYANQPQTPLVVFHTPGSSSLDLALHRKDNEWFIVFPRAYGMAESRYYAKLNHPESSDLSTGPPTSHPHLHHRFWFNTNDCRLEDILNANPPVLKRTGTSRKEESAAPGQPDVDAEQVEVLIGEEELCRRCAYCGSWETTPLEHRWYKVGQEGDNLLYWCGYCNRQASLWTWLHGLWAGQIPDTCSDHYF